jgi:hypothetical protein
MAVGYTKDACNTLKMSRSTGWTRIEPKRCCGSLPQADAETAQ